MVCPSFSIALKLDSCKDFAPIGKHLKVNYRVVSVPEVSVSAYLSFVCDKLFFNESKDEFASRIEKGFEIVNKCCGYKALGLE